MSRRGDTEVQTTGRLSVLVATPRFHPDVGGVETHVREVGRRLARQGVAITVLTTATGSRAAEREAVDGITVIRAPARPRGGDLRLAQGLGRLLRAARYDVLHVQSYHTLLAPQLMAWALRNEVPYVLTFHAGGHSSRLRSMLRPAQQLALRPLLARARALIALTPAEVAHYGRLLRLPDARFAVIPNGSDLPSLDDPPAREPGLIVSIGRLERYKGHQHVIAALPEVRRVRRDAHLWVAGVGPYEADLMRLARDVGVGAHVEIRGVPPHDRAQMAAGLMRADLVVLLSAFETHPIAALEALALRCRVVVADAPGLRELAGNGPVGVVGVAGGPSAVAAAILAGMESPPPTVAPPLTTWDECAQMLLALYARVRRRP